jgi:hypothetical protein
VRGGRQAATTLGVRTRAGLAVSVALSAPDDGLPVALATLCIQRGLFLWIVARWQFIGCRAALYEHDRRARERR